MLNFQLNFELDEENINTFLIGSTSLLEIIEKICFLFADSIDVDIKINSKLIELEKKKIVYLLKIDIEYSKQLILGMSLSHKQVDQWFSLGLSKLLSNSSEKKLDSIVTKIGLDKSFIFVNISENILNNLLKDLEKLSILLFNKLVFFEI